MNSSSKGHYRPDVDGLRAVAILLVVIFHAFPKAIAGGFIGVDIFFVISGYLITGIIYRELKDGHFSIAKFYARRCRRILPALILVLIAVWISGALILLPDEFASLGEHVFAAAGFFSNFQLFNETGYFAAIAEEKPLLHLWSLAIEEQFYLVWPLIMMACVRWRLSLFATAFILCFVSFALNVKLVNVDENTRFGFFMLPTRLWELAIGGMLAIKEVRLRLFLSSSRCVLLRRLLPGLGLILIVVAAFTLNKKTLFPGWQAAIPLIGTAFVIAGGIGKTHRGFLASRQMVFIGLISYPLYLWHWPLLAYLRACSCTVETEPGRVEKFLALAVAFVLAWMTRKFIEQPVRRMTSGKPPVIETRKVVTVGLSALLMLGALGWATKTSLIRRPNQDVLADFVNVYRNYDSQQIYRIDKCDFKVRQPRDPMSECIERQPGQKAIFLWGDSHAEQLYPGLAARYQKDVSILQVTSSGCPPLLNNDLLDSVCKRSNQFAIKNIIAQRPDVVVMAGLWSEYAEGDFARQFDETIARLNGIGIKRVVVVGGVPQWYPTLYKNLALRMLTGQGVPERMHNNKLADVLRGDNLIQGRRKTGQGFAFLSVIDSFCRESECLVHVSSRNREELTTFDYGHLTKSGSEYLVSQYLAPLLEVE